jgi:hypothetical protein
MTRLRGYSPHVPLHLLVSHSQYRVNTTGFQNILAALFQRGRVALQDPLDASGPQTRSLAPLFRVARSGRRSNRVDKRRECVWAPCL